MRRHDDCDTEYDPDVSRMRILRQHACAGGRCGAWDCYRCRGEAAAERELWGEEDDDDR